MLDHNKIDDDKLFKYISFKLNKLDNDFSIEELKRITEVFINLDEMSNEVFNDIIKLKNLESIIIKNGTLYKEDINKLLSLNYLCKLSFDNVFIEEIDFSKFNIIELTIIKCNINDFSFINKSNVITKLSLVNCDININNFDNLNELDYLELSGSNVNNNFNINNITIKELYIDDCNINDLTFINKLINLKRLSIDKEQYDNNKNLVDELEKKGVLVLYNNMVEFRWDE